MSSIYSTTDTEAIFSGWGRSGDTIDADALMADLKQHARLHRDDPRFIPGIIARFQVAIDVFRRHQTEYPFTDAAVETVWSLMKVELRFATTYIVDHGPFSRWYRPIIDERTATRANSLATMMRVLLTPPAGFPGPSQADPAWFIGPTRWFYAYPAIASSPKKTLPTRRVIMDLFQPLVQQELARAQHEEEDRQRQRAALEAQLRALDAGRPGAPHPPGAAHPTGTQQAAGGPGGGKSAKGKGKGKAKAREEDEEEWVDDGGAEEDGDGEVEVVETPPKPVKPRRKTGGARKKAAKKERKDTGFRANAWGLAGSVSRENINFARSEMQILALKPANGFLDDADAWSIKELHGIDSRTALQSDPPCQNCVKREEPCWYRGYSSCLNCNVHNTRCDGLHITFPNEEDGPEMYRPDLEIRERKMEELMEASFVSRAQRDDWFDEDYRSHPKATGRAQGTTSATPAPTASSVQFATPAPPERAQSSLPHARFAESESDVDQQPYRATHGLLDHQSESDSVAQVSYDEPMAVDAPRKRGRSSSTFTSPSAPPDAPPPKKANTGAHHVGQGSYPPPNVSGVTPAGSGVAPAGSVHQLDPRVVLPGSASEWAPRPPAHASQQPPTSDPSVQAQLLAMNERLTKVEETMAKLVASNESMEATTKDLNTMTRVNWKNVMEWLRANGQGVKLYKPGDKMPEWSGKIKTAPAATGHQAGGSQMSGGSVASSTTLPPAFTPPLQSQSASAGPPPLNTASGPSPQQPQQVASASLASGQAHTPAPTSAPTPTTVSASMASALPPPQAPLPPTPLSASVAAAVPLPDTRTSSPSALATSGVQPHVPALPQHHPQPEVHQAAAANPAGVLFAPGGVENVPGGYQAPTTAPVQLLPPPAEPPRAYSPAGSHLAPQTLFQPPAPATNLASPRLAAPPMAKSTSLQPPKPLASAPVITRSSSAGASDPRSSGYAIPPVPSTPLVQPLNPIGGPPWTPGETDMWNHIRKDWNEGPAAAYSSEMDSPQALRLPPRTETQRNAPDVSMDEIRAPHPFPNSDEEDPASGSVPVAPFPDSDDESGKPRSFPASDEGSDDGVQQERTRPPPRKRAARRQVSESEEDDEEEDEDEGDEDSEEDGDGDGTPEQEPAATKGRQLRNRQGGKAVTEKAQKAQKAGGSAATSSAQGGSKAGGGRGKAAPKPVAVRKPAARGRGGRRK
ncbi:unnamed protein product [Peniophora sp. CBMAI 1063]|nr:unnamed protein product [Peniophora sp. CBMAI 1063]